MFVWIKSMLFNDKLKNITQQIAINIERLRNIIGNKSHFPALMKNGYHKLDNMSLLLRFLCKLYIFRSETERPPAMYDLLLA